MKFNVLYRDRSSDAAVTAAYLKGTKRSEIEWVYIIDACRMATDAEIKSLCDGSWKGI